MPSGADPLGGGRRPRRAAADIFQCLRQRVQGVRPTLTPVRYITSPDTRRARRAASAHTSGFESHRTACCTGPDPTPRCPLLCLAQWTQSYPPETTAAQPTPYTTVARYEHPRIPRSRTAVTRKHLSEFYVRWTTRYHSEP